ncbi:MAG: DUF2339 domain-containing protein, partial [Methylococcales bacterium]|nr:DUF2339 domain-containing protein [Methylococcales bacterium]
MDDFFGFIAFVVIVVPVVFIVMLAMLMTRQNRYRDEISQSLSQIEKALREDRKLLKELSKRLIEPVAETPQPAVFEPQTSATEQVLFEIPATEAIVEPSPPQAEITEIVAEPPVTITLKDDWNQNTWQPAEPSRFELAAKQILQEIWNWIIVGEGHRPEGMAMEYAVASNWLLRVGVLILVTGIGFFLKYSIDNGLIGEQARVALSVLAGVGMIVGGMRLVGGKYHLFSQGLLGGGIAVLYFSVFAAHSFYHLLDVFPTFALMILVTACAATLAIRLDSMLVA